MNMRLKSDNYILYTFIMFYIKSIQKRDSILFILKVMKPSFIGTKYNIGSLWDVLSSGFTSTFLTLRIALSWFEKYILQSLLQVLYACFKMRGCIHISID